MLNLSMSFTNNKVLLALTILFLFMHTEGSDVMAQEVVTVKQGTTEKEILVLPFSYSEDSTLSDKGEVKVTKLRKVYADFKSQLNRAAVKTATAGGNILMIDRIQDHNQKGKYKIWGTTFYAAHYEQVKALALARKKEKLENGKYGYLVVYRPVYNSGFNDDMDMTVVIDDTLKLDLKGNTKYVIQYARDCDMKIADPKELLVRHIHAQTGMRYYVRGYVNIPGSGKLVKTGENNVEIGGRQRYFEIIDEAQGDLESSLVSLITISKKL